MINKENEPKEDWEMIDPDDFLKPMEDGDLSDILIPLTIPAACLMVILYTLFCR